MVTLRLKNKKIAEKFHKALIGTTEYVNSKIVISEFKDGSGRYDLIFGDENNNDLTVFINDMSNIYD